MTDVAIVSVSEDPRVCQSGGKKVLWPEDSLFGVRTQQPADLGGTLVTILPLRRAAIHVAIGPCAPRVSSESMHEDNTILTVNNIIL